MAEKLISVYSSLALKDADQIITHALELRVANKLLPLAIVVLDSGGTVVVFKREDGCGILRHDMPLARLGLR